MPLDASWMPLDASGCPWMPLGACWVSPGNLPVVSWCLLDVSWVSPESLLGAPGSLLDVSWVSPGVLPLFLSLSYPLSTNSKNNPCLGSRTGVIYIYIYMLIHISSFCLWRIPPLGESIFRILTFLKSLFCLRGLPFGGIHFQSPDLFEELFLSVGSPLLGNPFSGS